MIIISLSSDIAGPACAVATSIKKNIYENKNYPTNYFDYLVVSLKSINQLLKIGMKNINILKNILKNELNIYENDTEKMTVEFLNFDKMISYHDLDKNYSEKDLSEFIDKYIRRYYRLLEYIKKEKLIYFIRYGDENDQDIIEFNKNISLINPKLHFFFVNLIYKEYTINNIYDAHNYMLINFKEINIEDIEYSEDLFYKTLQFNWMKIFEIINNHYLDYTKIFN